MDRLARIEVLARSISCGCAASLIGFWVLSRFPQTVEQFYSASVFPIIALLQGMLVGWLPLSVAEMMVLALPGAVAIVVLAVFVSCRQSGWAGLMAWTWPSLAVVLSVAVAGYLFWGLNYARPDLRARLGWDADQRPDQALLVRAGSELVEMLAATYPEGGGNDRWDFPADWEHLDWELRRGISEATGILSLSVVQPSGAAKRVRLSRPMSYLGISGVYFPWTGEANVNVDIPQVQLPHVTAHEKVHQLGVAPENEANFLAFVACLASLDPRVVYSGALFGFRQVYGQLRRADPEAGRQLWESLPSGVETDIRAMAEYWRQFEGPVERVAASVNDRYLRSQGVRSGIRSYNESVQLILSYWKRHPGPATDASDRRTTKRRMTNDE